MDTMSDRLSDEKITELCQTFRQLYEAMPQPDLTVRLAACYCAIAQVSGLNEKEATRALALAASNLNHLPHAKVSIYNRNGRVDSFVTEDFQFDIRPGSPYYTDAS